jgi:hypothetical protein
MPLAFPSARCPSRAAAAALALAAAIACGPAFAALYKWVDESGRVTYSDTPPPAGVKAEIVSAPAAPAGGDAVRSLAAQEADLKKREKERADAKAKADKARVAATQNEQFCQEARNRLKLYQSGQYIATGVDEKGAPVFLDAAAVSRERERIEATIRERCAG